MSTEEQEVTIEISCTRLPGTQWSEHGPVHLGIQQDDAVVQAAPADRKSIVFRPTFRVRRHTDGSANFLGPFAHGPRAERFIYLVWVIVEKGVVGGGIGRIKLHLNHIGWKDVQKMVAQDKPVKVSIELTNDKGKPVHASVRPGVAKWVL